MPEFLSAKGWTQAEFARRMEVSEAFISQLIAGHKYFSYPLAIKAARLLGCSVEELHEIDE